jgi:hypothetical protein
MPFERSRDLGLILAESAGWLTTVPLPSSAAPGTGGVGARAVGTRAASRRWRPSPCRHTPRTASLPARVRASPSLPHRARHRPSSDPSACPSASSRAHDPRSGRGRAASLRRASGTCVSTQPARSARHNSQGTRVRMSSCKISASRVRCRSASRSSFSRSFCRVLLGLRLQLVDLLVRQLGLRLGSGSGSGSSSPLRAPAPRTAASGSARRRLRLDHFARLGIDALRGLPFGAHAAAPAASRPSP